MFVYVNICVYIYSVIKKTNIMNERPIQPGDTVRWWTGNDIDGYKDYIGIVKRPTSCPVISVAVIDGGTGTYMVQLDRLIICE